MKLIHCVVMILFLVAASFHSSDVSAQERRLVAVPCPTDSPYLVNREAGKLAFSERTNEDLLAILIDNDPNTDGLGTCLDALNLAEQIAGLFTPSIYVNAPGILGVLNFIRQQVIEGLCTELLEFAQESYADISDIVPAGTYIVEVDDLASAGAGLGQ